MSSPVKMSWLVVSTFADSNEIFAALTLRLSTCNIKFTLKLHKFDLCHLLLYLSCLLLLLKNILFGLMSLAAMKKYQLLLNQ